MMRAESRGVEDGNGERAGLLPTASTTAHSPSTRTPSSADAVSHGMRSDYVDAALSVDDVFAFRGDVFINSMGCVE